MEFARVEVVELCMGEWRTHLMTLPKMRNQGDQAKKGKVIEL